LFDWNLLFGEKEIKNFGSLFFQSGVLLDSHGVFAGLRVEMVIGKGVIFCQACI